MRCISPLLIRKNGERNIVPCGRCNFCLQTKRSDWTFRLLQELKCAESAYFLTLTYEDDRLPVSEAGLPELRKKHYQDFKKRLRKRHAKSSDTPLRYYAVGEYGTQTERPHYHAILFNLAQIEDAHAAWMLGHVHVGDVSIASIHYVTKYVINRMTDYPGREPPFSLMSRRPAIGAAYLDTHTSWHRAGKRNFTQVQGIVSRLPRYYKEKIFSKHERALFAAESVPLGDIAYWEAIESLAPYHSDPENYYEQSRAHAHDVILKNINKTNKI